MFESVKVGGRGKPDVLVVGRFAKTPLDKATAALDPSGALAAAAQRPEGSGEAGKIAEAFPTGRGAPAERILLVGLGPKDSFKAGDLRNIAGTVGRRLAAIKAQRAQIELSEPLRAAKANGEHAGRAFGEGMGLIGWVCDQFKGKGTEKPSRAPLSLTSTDDEFQTGMSRGVAMAESANFTRTLSETPPNIATPAWIASQAQRLAKETGLSVRVFKGAELEREKFVGLLNVGKASENQPCMIRLEYRPRIGRAADSRGRTGKPIVLVGKTMTYDTGGLSLKINNGMVGMKRDKDGGCAVLGAMHAIATVIRPKVPVVALLASAENSISDEAYRPDDILTFRNGVTVEVTNTDAEGRLVLADALCWACEKENPQCIVDIATLTGGVVTALGSTFAGLFCEDDALRARLERAMSFSGERFWRLPMDKEYRDMMKSPVADIVNSNPNRKAHPIQGAAFLSYFVNPEIPWAHLDIAGVHVADADSGPFVKGPTGWGARLLAEFVGID
jgi:leucyl aminopeptidase